MNPKPITIPLMGINRAASDGNVENGNMDEVINLRKVNGHYETVGNFPSLKDSLGYDIDVSPYNKIFLHKTANFIHFLVIRGGKIFFLNDGVETPVVNLPENINIPLDLSITYLSNVVDISYRQGDEIVQFYLYWNGSDYQYLDLNNIAPFIELKRTVNIRYLVIRSEFTSTYGPQRNENIYNLILPKTIKTISKLKSEGHVCGMFTWMYAIRLFDGTYIMTSPLHIASQFNTPGRIYSKDFEHGEDIKDNGTAYPYDFFYLYSSNNEKNTSNCYIYASINSSDLSVLLSGLSSLIPLKDFIISIDFFMSTPILPIYTEDQYDSSKMGSPPFAKSNEDLKKEFDLKSSLFKFASFDIEDLDMDAVSQTKTIEDFDFTNLENQERWDSSFDDYSRITSKISYIYNSKNHRANLQTKLFNGFPLKYLQDQPIIYNAVQNTDTTFGSITAFDKVIIITYLKTDKGEAIVRTDKNILDALTFNNAFNKIGGLVTYPDSRAYRMEICIARQLGNIPMGYYLTINLKPHPDYNLAYYISPDFRPITPVAIGQIPAWANLINSLPSAINTIESRPNIIKVSDVDNLFTYPVEQTYQVGTDEVIGLCSNTKAVSTGQFGEYPLYAFCSDGIFALGLGSGDIEYSSIKPVSRDVCNNPESITPIDNAVVFSSNRGLLMIAGEDVREFSTPIEGKPFHFLEGYSKIDLLEKALSNDKLVQLLESVSLIDFNDYIKSADIGFVYNNTREILVSNPNYKYSYTFSLDTQLWTKIDTRISSFISNTPYLYGISDGRILDLTKEQKSEDKQTFFLTRPIKLQGQHYIRPVRAILRSLISPVQYSGLYVFGTVDGLIWRFIGGKEYNGAIRENNKLHDFLNIGCDLSREKMRYIRIAYVGNIKQNSRLENLELYVFGTEDNSD